VGRFFKCFYWPWFSTQIQWEDSVLLWLWVERRSVGKLTSFLRKGSSKYCIIVKIDNVYFKCTYFFLSLLHLGHFGIKMWLPLQIYSQFPVSGKIFLYSILIFSRFSSIIHSVEQKSISLIFRTSHSGSDVRYSCHHNLSHFSFPIFAHSWCFSIFHSLQPITPRIH